MLHCFRCLTYITEYIGDDEMVILYCFADNFYKCLYLSLKAAFRGLIPKVIPAIQRLLAESEVSVAVRFIMMICVKVVYTGSCMWGYGTVWRADRMRGCHSSTIPLTTPRVLPHGKYTYARAHTHTHRAKRYKVKLYSDSFTYVAEIALLLGTKCIWSSVIVL